MKTQNLTYCCTIHILRRPLKGKELENDLRKITNLALLELYEEEWKDLFSISERF